MDIRERRPSGEAKWLTRGASWGWGGGGGGALPRYIVKKGPDIKFLQ
jgi:hypothetical protein